MVLLIRNNNFVQPAESETHFHSDDSEILDRLFVMKRQEETTYRCSDYMAENSKYLTNVAEPVDESCRIKMCEWCFSCVDICGFSRESVVIAMSYVDRYLCTKLGPTILANRHFYTLLFMTALYMAIKVNERTTMAIELLVKFGDGKFTADDIKAMEMSILSLLEWKINGPTALDFVRCYLDLLPESVDEIVLSKLLEKARCQIERDLVESSFAAKKSSRVAFSAILNATLELDNISFPSDLKNSLFKVMKLL